MRASFLPTAPKYHGAIEIEVIADEFGTPTNRDHDVIDRVSHVSGQLNVLDRRAVKSPVEMAFHDKPGPAIREVTPKPRHVVARYALDIAKIPPARPAVARGAAHHAPSSH